MGILERKEREKQQRRKDIISAAEGVFFLKGFERATMDDVAEKAELSKGTLYLYFKSKEDLHLAVAMKAIEQLSETTDRIRNSEVNGLQKLVQLGRAFIQFARQFPDHMNAILRLEGMDLKNTSMSTADMRQFLFERSPVKLVLEFISQGLEENVIRKDIEPQVIAHTLWMQTLGIIQVLAFKKSLFEIIELSPDELFENHIELLLNGIRVNSHQ